MQEMTRYLVALLCTALGVSCDLRSTNPKPSDPPEVSDAPPHVAQAERGIQTPAADGMRRTGDTPSQGTVPNDVGIFPDLDDQAAVRCPNWLRGPSLPVRIDDSDRVWRSIGGVIVCAEPESSDSSEAVLSLAPGRYDRDGDGIPDTVDILRGAKKTVANATPYTNTYRVMDYPGGDMPRDEGVCTDVIVRAFRNAGMDLQQLVHEDIRANPRRYPMVKSPDRNIDHRRVKTILPYFLAHYEELGTNPNDTADPFMPGDLVFFNTLGDWRPDHLGIVSDQLAESGQPLVINNWTQGTTTSEMDTLPSVPVTHRFRMSRPLHSQAESARGVAGLFERRGINVPEKTEQMLLVVTPLWDSSGGLLHRYERTAGDWQPVGKSFPVRVGRSGLGKGLGLHAASANAGAPEKREGDGRAPAGVFSLDVAFGPRSTGPHAPSKWPWRPTSMYDFFVDDADSPLYNTWQHLPRGRVARWNSAERLIDYSLGVVVNHNPQQQPGAGSAIFLHPWKKPSVATAGCTAMDNEQLVEILRWLRPEAKPVLTQTAGTLL